MEQIQPGQPNAFLESIVKCDWTQNDWTQIRL